MSRIPWQLMSALFTFGICCFLLGAQWGRFTVNDKCAESAETTRMQACVREGKQPDGR